MKRQAKKPTATAISDADGNHSRLAAQFGDLCQLKSCQFIF